MKCREICGVKVPGHIGSPTPVVRCCVVVVVACGVCVWRAVVWCGVWWGRGGVWCGEIVRVGLGERARDVSAVTMRRAR